MKNMHLINLQMILETKNEFERRQNITETKYYKSFIREDWLSRVEKNLFFFKRAYKGDRVKKSATRK